MPAAVVAMQALLSRHASNPPMRILAANVANTAGLPGWCALDSAGRLHADATGRTPCGRPSCRGQMVGPNLPSFPPGESISVSRHGVALLGSPIDRDAIDAIEGFVEAKLGDVAGWIWHPHNPDRDPRLACRGQADSSRANWWILWRAAAHWPARASFGSLQRICRLVRSLLRPKMGDPCWAAPLDPGLERRSAAGIEATGFHARMGGHCRPDAPRAKPARASVDVVIPVHGGREVTLACLESVIADAAARDRACMSWTMQAPDPLLAAELDRLASKKRIVLPTAWPSIGVFPVRPMSDCRLRRGAMSFC